MELDRLFTPRGNMPWLRDRTIFLTRHGSHAYGTNTPTSDEDFKGVAVPPIEYFLGFTQKFEQAESKAPNPDLVIYELRKFMALARDCNPNIIEVLWTDPSDHLICTPLGQMLVDNREAFISKKAKFTFSGYAIAQLKRIKTHHRWLITPPVNEPRRAGFGLPNETLIPADQLAAAQAEVSKQLDRWNEDFGEGLDEATKIQARERMAQYLTEMKLTQDAKWLAAARMVGLDDNFILHMQRENMYANARREWEQYQNWKKTRNASRAALEAKYGYDCYLDDTEFLTNDGWKRYDEITSAHQLATLNQMSGEIEYQHFTDRVVKLYTGKIAFLHPRHTNCAVTLNHRMWVSPAHRSSANGFSSAYVAEESEWSIQAMGDLLAERRSLFHVRVTGRPRAKDFDVSDDMLTLMGCYVSEGCVGKRRVDGTASVLRLSQKVGGRQEIFADALYKKYPTIRRFTYTHDDETRSEPCEENVWTVAHREWAQNMESWCGSGSESKHLPPWVTQLSARQVDLLLNVMVSGDGTDRPFSRVYYTSSKRLADDVQAMCVAGGVVSQVWGPYANRDDAPMYQVYIGQRLDAVTACFSDDSKHITIEEVSNARIVCFTVPNEILVTRRKGNVAIQGNTKHAMHLVRLMRMCREILETGKVNVKREDSEQLLAIRNGAWSVEEVFSWAAEQDAAMNELYNTSTLRHAPDQKALDALCVRIVEGSFKPASVV